MSQEAKIETDGTEAASSEKKNPDTISETPSLEVQVEYQTQSEAPEEEIDAGTDDALLAEAMEASDATEADDDEASEANTVGELEEKLATAVAEKEAALEKLQYQAAEFQNIRKRQEQRLAEAIERANASLIRRILPVLDDLELAFANVPQSLDVDKDSDVEAWLSGLQQIQKKLLNMLQEEGVTPIDTSGEFDPNLHEAVLSEPSDEVESGHVIGSLRTGYEYKGQVLRPSMVRVAS